MSQSILPIKDAVYHKSYIPHEMQNGNIPRKMKAANKGANSMGMYSYHSQENILNTKYHPKTVLIQLCMKYSTNL